MNKPIGVIDSGVGGLTVAQEIMRQLPNEKIIYVGDTKRCPYGPRPKEEVIQFTIEMVDFLLQKDIKMLVIACNTATAFALNELQQYLDIPVIGVIQPGARTALKVTENFHIGVIGTEGTIGSGAYTKALEKINQNIKVYSLACPLFVPMVEKGILDGPEAEQVIETSLISFKDKPMIDTLILGCTHYPLIKDTIQDVLGDSISIISSSEETAREASTILDVNNLLNESNHNPEHEFYATGDLQLFKEISSRLFMQTDLYSLQINNVKLHQLEGSFHFQLLRWKRS